jgi:hypothetical protein
MILVPFFPSTRSTLVVQILDALGFFIIRDPDDPNWEPKGAGNALNTVGAPENSAIKVAMPAFMRSTLTPQDRIILPLRPPASVEASITQRGFLIPAKRQNYSRCHAQFAAWQETAPNPVLILDTDALLRTPQAGVARIATFLGVQPNQAARDLINADRSDTTERPEPPDVAQAAFARLRGRV